MRLLDRRFSLLTEVELINLVIGWQVLQKHVWIGPDEGHSLRVLTNTFQTLDESHQWQIISNFKGQSFFVLAGPLSLQEFELAIEDFF